MAMTDLEKAQNKAANKVRDRAHTARYREMAAALKAAEESPAVVEAHRVYEQANAAMEAAMAARNAKVAELEAQIAALRKEIEGLNKSPEIAELAQKRREASSAWLKLKTEHVEAAEAKFPDMQGGARFSAPGWKPPKEVLEAMEEARRTAKVEPPKAKAAG